MANSTIRILPIYASTYSGISLLKNLFNHNSFGVWSPIYTTWKNIKYKPYKSHLQYDLEKKINRACSMSKCNWSLWKNIQKIPEFILHHVRVKRVSESRHWLASQYNCYALQQAKLTIPFSFLLKDFITKDKP